MITKSSLETIKSLDKEHMNKEVKKKWIAALRSGEYNQIDGRLASEDGSKHCCLGVLCELGTKEKICEKVVDNSELIGYDDESHELPISVQHWAVINENPNICIDIENDLNKEDSEKVLDYLKNNLLIDDDGIINYSLAECNDKLKLSFNTIADLIEKKL